MFLLSFGNDQVKILTMSSESSLATDEILPYETFICIHCKWPSNELYSVFPGSGCLRIEHCTNCKRPVDKYIEYDVTLHLLDLMLLNKLVWRHTLYNQDLGFLHWKLAVVCLFCDGYMKWAVSTQSSDSHRKDQNVVFQAAKQVELYMLTLTSLLELLAFLLILLLLYSVVHKVTSNIMKEMCSYEANSTDKTSLSKWSDTLFPVHTVNSQSIIRCLLLSNAGKLLFIPALIWAESDSEFYLKIILMYVLVCNAVALCTTLHCSVFVSLGIVVASNALSTICVFPVNGWMQSVKLPFPI